VEIYVNMDDLDIKQKKAEVKFSVKDRGIGIDESNFN